MLIHTVWYGTFVFDGSREVDFRGAGRDPRDIVEDLLGISRGEILDRERAIVEDHKIDLVTEERLRKLATGADLTDVGDIELPSACDKGYEVELLIEANTRRAELLSNIDQDDWDILSAVGALDDIETSLNLLLERIREWYGKYWSRASGMIAREDVLRVLSSDSSTSGLRDILVGIGKDPGPSPEPPIPHNSGISELAERTMDLITSRKRLESYIEGKMEAVAPNLTEVLGPLIGARLIHSAGGLERLCKLPASTVQVLGAEKAFFRFLKDGGKPPKHGVLFQHPMVHSMKRDKRGKAARALASNGSLAARLDYYGGYDAGRLKEKLDSRLERIREEESSTVDKRGGRQPPFREGWWAKKGKKKRKGRRR